jgi:UDP-N-acetylglucosamine 4,6-dehydratase
MDGKTVLITGGTGTLGRALVRHILEYSNPKRIRILSRSEYNQFMMKESLRSYPKLKFILGDVRDRERVEMACRNADIVINCAAMKRIEACQADPLECKKTNVDGVENIIRAAFKNNVEKVLQISTDKAVYATTLYGKSKAMAEDLIIDANWYSGEEKPSFSCARFGNFVGSTGSVVEIFERQKEKGRLTVTHSDMTRFFISPKEAAAWCYKWCLEMEGGEIFFPRMREQKILEIAEKVCPECEIDYVGIREMEKIKEVMHSEEERPIMADHGSFYVIRPNQVN